MSLLSTLGHCGVGESSSAGLGSPPTLPAKQVLSPIMETETQQGPGMGPLFWKHMMGKEDVSIHTCCPNEPREEPGSLTPPTTE